jgi:hypothetical protein
LVLTLAGCAGSAGHGGAGAPLTTRAGSAGRVSSTSISAAAEPCHTSNLQIAGVNGNGAMGHAIAVFELANVAGSSCRLFGSPGVEVLDSQGRSLAQGLDQEGFIFSNEPPVPVALRPGEGAYFGVESTTNCPGDDPPRMSESIIVTPPQEASSLTVAARMTVCTPPHIVVSPIRPNQDQLSAR